MIIKSREVSESELIEVAKIVTGSEYPEDYNLAIQDFKEFIRLLRLT